MPNEKEPDCTQCHHFCRVEGEPACTKTPQEPGKPCYKILTSLTPCNSFWGIRKRRGNPGTVI